ncbi:DinB family protein [Serinibacter salmoneus]|uniref:Putative damage-inducible protein DinB n=1 Tax=Serinibacter salmoneus TaxID=556530 RepID=A0A2A9CWQ9_9MICO|nr:DinB family protein [Serinibacter salmoneus]PFG18843.1 putative damage-inducible protein DinB [Serinibacter salmoneus]
MDEKAELNRHLRQSRSQVRAKLDGLSEVQVRWPLTRTGTNLLGLLKHTASVELGYVTVVFGRPEPELPWFADEAEVNADMWATAQESREEILALADLAEREAEATFAAHPLEAVGRVPWWGTHGREVTLREIMLHLVVEYARHAGHADILRELLDGGAGNGDGNLPEQPEGAWASYRDRLEGAALAASGASGPPSLWAPGRG